MGRSRPPHPCLVALERCKSFLGRTLQRRFRLARLEWFKIWKLFETEFSQLEILAVAETTLGFFLSATETVGGKLNLGF